MSDHTWTFVKEISSGRHRAKCQIWLVERELTGSVQQGYFKISDSEKEAYIGPLIANELTAYHLAKLLDLPIAETEYARIGGKQGVVSIARPCQPLVKWGKLDHSVYNDIARHVKNHHDLIKTFVFDVWIVNIDRHSRNLIAYPMDNKYEFYLIDHGLTLAGAIQFRKKDWQDPYWDQVSLYNHRYVNGLNNYLTTYEQLLPAIEEIQRVSSQSIKAAIGAVPNDVISTKTKRNMKRFLVDRRRKLDQLISIWFKEFKSANWEET